LTYTLDVDAEYFEYEEYETGLTEEDASVTDEYEFRLQASGTIRFDDDLVFITPDTFESTDPDAGRDLVVDEEIFFGFLLSYDVMVFGSETTEDKHAGGFIKQD
jgi:hypothetical protein